ncbi:MAG: zinc metallopeptidase [Phycisphaerales bacterium]
MILATTLAATLGMVFGFDPLYFVFVGPAMLLALWAQWKVKSTYAMASRVPAQSGMSGAEAAHMLLQSYGIRDVGIEESHGFLSDHYDPKAKMLRLSHDVYHGHSVASLGIAAHEAGHAIQHATGYAPLKFRNGLVGFAMVGGQFSWILIFAGFALGAAGTVAGKGFLLAGIGLFSLTVLFQLINLPVEFDASKRAKDLLRSAGIVREGEEYGAMKRVLSAAAMTYVAATVAAAATLLYYLVRSGLLGGNNNRS